jgi:hypothetical protein
MGIRTATLPRPSPKPYQLNKNSKVRLVTTFLENSGGYELSRPEASDRSHRARADPRYQTPERLKTAVIALTKGTQLRGISRPDDGSPAVQKVSPSSPFLLTRGFPMEVSRSSVGNNRVRSREVEVEVV